MRSSPAKYLFDNDFAAPERSRSAAVLAEQAAKLAEAEAAGYRRGLAAARTEAEHRAAAALERIAAGLADLDRGLTAAAARLEGEAVEVAVAVARKLAPALMAREPLAELAALAAGCFRQLVAAPHVVVRVNDALATRRTRRARSGRARRRLRRPPGGPGRARHRARRLPHRMGGRRRQARARGASRRRSTRRSAAISLDGTANPSTPDTSRSTER